MRKIKLTNDEIEAVRFALRFYKDETSHDRPDLPKVDGSIDVSPGLPLNSKENKLLTSVIIKLEDTD